MSDSTPTGLEWLDCCPYSRVTINVAAYFLRVHQSTLRYRSRVGIFPAFDKHGFDIEELREVLIRIAASGIRGGRRGSMCERIKPSEYTPLVIPASERVEFTDARMAARASIDVGLMCAGEDVGELEFEPMEEIDPTAVLWCPDGTSNAFVFVRREGAILVPFASRFEWLKPASIRRHVARFDEIAAEVDGQDAGALRDRLGAAGYRRSTFDRLIPLIDGERFGKIDVQLRLQCAMAVRVGIRALGRSVEEFAEHAEIDLECTRSIVNGGLDVEHKDIAAAFCAAGFAAGDVARWLSPNAYDRIRPHMKGPRHTPLGRSHEYIPELDDTNRDSPPPERLERDVGGILHGDSV